MVGGDILGLLFWVMGGRFVVCHGSFICAWCPDLRVEWLRRVGGGMEGRKEEGLLFAAGWIVGMWIVWLAGYFEVVCIGRISMECRVYVQPCSNSEASSIGKHGLEEDACLPTHIKLQ